jgi:serine/threonine protein kinase
LSTSSQGDDDLAGSQSPRGGLEGSVTVFAQPSPHPALDPAVLSTALAPSTPEPSACATRHSGGAPPAPQPAYPTIPGYDILDHLGKGGMGQVFKARPVGTDRLVALKVIRSDRQEDVQLVRRFQREAKAGSRLDHPNIVAFYEAQQVENVCFLTMELVDGRNLAQLLEQADGPLPVPLACECARQAALGLQHAHERGLIHRDIKPSNLLLTNEGRVVKILDMGLVRLGACPETGHAETDLTHSGVMMGTPAYMAPEQVFDARNVDGRADIYSLGCTLYELLAGRPPHRHQMKEPLALNWVRPEVSPVLAAVVQRMMARMPEDRYVAAVDVVKALTPFSHDRADAWGHADEPANGPSAGARPDAAAMPRVLRWLLWLALVGALLLFGIIVVGQVRG